MKKLFLLLFILGSGLAYSQTTQDEYNYMTKGWLTMQQQGLGNKAGYTTADKGKYTMEFPGFNLEVSVQSLLRTADNSLAGYIVMVHDTKKNNTQYFGVPTKNSDQAIWNQTVSAIRVTYAKDQTGYEAIMYAMMHVAGQ